MILRTLQERAGIVGRIVIGLIGVAWNVITFFVVPVLLYEPVGVPEAIKRSASIFRQRWGEQFIGTATIGLAIFLVAIPVVLVGGAIAYAVPLVGVPLLVVAIGALMAVGAACSGVFNAALYRFATTGEASSVFSIEDLNGSFRPKKGFFGKDASRFGDGRQGFGTSARADAGHPADAARRRLALVEPAPASRLARVRPTVFVVTTGKG